MASDKKLSLLVPAESYIMITIENHDADLEIEILRFSFEVIESTNALNPNNTVG